MKAVKRGVLFGVILGALLTAGASSAVAAPEFTQCPAIGADTGCQWLINVTNNGSTLSNDNSQLAFANSSLESGGAAAAQDSLIGIQNYSSVPISSVSLGTSSTSGGEGAFQFDGDGICDTGSGPNQSFAPGCVNPSTNTSTGCGTYHGACAFPPPAGEGGGYNDYFGATVFTTAFPNGDLQNGYEGPTSWFSNVSADGTTGTVNFSPAIAPNGGSAYFSLETPPGSTVTTTGTGPAAVAPVPTTTAPTATPSLGASLHAAVVTELQTTLGVGGAGDPTVYVPVGVPVTDDSRISGASAATAVGSVTYGLYRDSACKTLLASGGVGQVTNGKAVSKPITIHRPGLYYWKASYSGDGTNAPSSSPCGAGKIVVPVAGTIGMPSDKRCIAGKKLVASLSFGSHKVRTALAYRNGIIVGRWSSGKISVAVGHGASRIALIVSYRPKAFVTGLTNPKQFDEQSGSYKSC